MWIDFTHTTAVQMERAGLAQNISLWDSLERAKRFYSSQEGKYCGYINPNPTHALATPVIILALKEGKSA